MHIILISPQTIDSTNRFQKGDTCVLLAYSLGASHFTGLKIDSFFEAYCRHFDLIFTNAEETYNADFNSPRWQNYGNGQKLILCLHENSLQDEFVMTRKHFKVEYIESIKKQVTTIIERLKSGSLLSMTLNLSMKNGQGTFIPRGTHSILTGWNKSNEKFFIIETTENLYFEDLRSIVSFEESLFFAKKHPEFNDIRPIIDGNYSSGYNNIQFSGGDGLLLTYK